MNTFNLLLEGLLFLLFANLQAIFINGVKASADGSVELRPDGKKIMKGMIFFPVAHWITRKTKVKVYYTAATLRGMIHDMIDKYPTMIVPNTLLRLEMYSDAPAEAYVKVSPGDDEYKAILQYISFLRPREGVQVYYYLPRRSVRLYKNYEEPVMPVWIRKPLIECIKCMASFWGAVTYWPAVTFFTGFHAWQLPLFAADVFILVFLNYYYYKKNI